MLLVETLSARLGQQSMDSEKSTTEKQGKITSTKIYSLH